MFGSRFVHPVHLATISTFYYAVPLAVAGYLSYNPRQMVFLHAQAADPALAFQSIVYAFAAMAALVSGSRIARFGAAPRLGTYFELSEKGLPRAWLAIGVLVALIGLGVMQFGIGDFLRGYATESSEDDATLGMALVYFSTGSLGLVAVYAVLLYRKFHQRELWLLIGAAIVTAVLVLLIREKRLEIVTTFLPLAIVLLAARGRLKVAVWRAVLGVLAVTALVVVAVTRINDQFDLFTINFYMLSEGLYAGHALPGIIYRLDANMLNYEYGVRFLNSLLAFVPRFVWESKDDFVYAGNLALEGVAPLGASTFLAEVVLQGGLIAVLLVHFVLGAIFEWSTKFEVVWDAARASGKIPGRFLIYIVLTAIFVPHFRDGIVPAIKLSLQAGVFLAVLTGLHLTPRTLLRSIRETAPAISAG
jgi:oligosaccharide repeat unit polymerase